MAQEFFDVKRIIRSYIKALESEGIHVQKAILYGSYARGNSHEGSDIDLVIISPDLKKIDFPYRLEFLSRITLNITGPLEVIGYTPEEVKGKEGESIFWDEICATGKVIYQAA